MDIKPAVILVQPQLGENIGHTARAMLNFGLTDLRLVKPRDGWPNPAAGPSAAGADVVLDGAQVFETTEDAIADCTLVFAATVRERGMNKPIATPPAAIAKMKAATLRGERPAIMLGPERSGLANDDIALADSILTVPVNPDFGSLNLAQAVLICAWEWAKASDITVPLQPSDAEGLAPKRDLIGLMEHMENALEGKGYFRSEDRRGSQRRMLRNLLQNAELSPQEVQTFRGIIKALNR